MPRTENQKVVTSYLSLELYDKLEQFKIEEGLKSDSKVINTILERWFFGEVPIPAIAKTNHLEERLSQVEKTCATLIEQVAGLIAFNTANVLSNVPDTVLSLLPDAVPDTVPDTVQYTVPDTVPDTVQYNVPNTVQYTVPDTVPDELLELSKGLSQRALSKRLNCSHAYIGKKEQEGIFKSLSASLDPEGLTWELKGSKYYPCDSTAKKQTSLSKLTEDLPPFVIYAFDRQANQYWYWEGVGRDRRGFGTTLPHALKYKTKATAQKSLEGIYDYKDNSLYAFAMDDTRFKVGFDTENFLRENRHTGVTRGT